jgi:Domain of unknown function (DUF222)
MLELVLQGWHTAASVKHMFGEDPQGLDQVLATLDHIAAADPTAMSDSELHQQVEQLAQARSRLEGIGARLLGEWDARMLYAERGAVTGAAWLRAHTDMTDAGRVLKQARKLRQHAPATAQAVAEGSLSYEKALAIVAPVTHDLADAFTRSEAAIVEAAKQVTLEDTKRLAASWRAIAENDLDIDILERQQNRRHLRVWDNPDATVEGKFLLDPINGAFFKAHLATFERRLFRDDVREARAVAGLPIDPDAAADGLALPRTPAQRKADALCDLVAAGVRVDPNADDGHLPAPSAELYVTVSDDHLAAATAHDVDCGCAHGTCSGALLDHQDHPIPNSLLVLMACDSVLYRLALDKAGIPLNLGRAQRRATPAALCLRQGAYGAGSGRLRNETESRASGQDVASRPSPDHTVEPGTHRHRSRNLRPGGRSPLRRRKEWPPTETTYPNPPASHPDRDTTHPMTSGEWHERGPHPGPRARHPRPARRHRLQKHRFHRPARRPDVTRRGRPAGGRAGACRASRRSGRGSDAWCPRGRTRP